MTNIQAVKLVGTKLHNPVSVKRLANGFKFDSLQCNTHIITHDFIMSNPFKKVYVGNKYVSVGMKVSKVLAHIDIPNSYMLILEPPKIKGVLIADKIIALLNEAGLYIPDSYSESLQASFK